MGNQTAVKEYRSVMDVEEEGTAMSRSGGGIAGLLDDLMALMELQLQLFKLDLRDCGRSAAVPIVVLAAAMVLLLSAIPVLMTAFAWLLINAAEWPHQAAFAMTGLVAFALAGAMGWFGWKKLKLAGHQLDRSQNELADNVKWLRRALRQERRGSY